MDALLTTIVLWLSLNFNLPGTGTVAISCQRTTS